MPKKNITEEPGQKNVRQKNAEKECHRGTRTEKCETEKCRKRMSQRNPDRKM
jgi:hypothetical protein